MLKKQKQKVVKGWTLKSSLENKSNLKVWLDGEIDSRYIPVEIHYHLPSPKKK